MRPAYECPSWPPSRGECTAPRCRNRWGYQTDVSEFEELIISCLGGRGIDIDRVYRHECAMTCMPTYLRTTSPGWTAKESSPPRESSIVACVEEMRRLQTTIIFWKCFKYKINNWKGWGLSAKLGKHSAIWGKLGTAHQAYTLKPSTKFPPNPTSRKVNT